MIEGLAGAESLQLKLRALNERGWSDAVTLEVHSPIANQQATTGEFITLATS